MLTTLRRITRTTAGLFGLAVVMVLAVVLLLAPVLAPYSFDQQDIPNRLQSPSAQHLLGTDHLGRDLLSRLIFGSRVALGVAFPSVLAALLIGLALGLASGYLGGAVDAAIILLTDTVQSFPALILALALLALIGPSIGSVMFVVALAFAPGYARVVRAQVQVVRALAFVEVGRALGANTLRIVLRHVLPNIVAPLIVLLAMDLPSAITIEAGLSFLGLGVRPPTPSWGVVLADGFGKIRQSPWPVLWASAALMLTTLGFTLFGEALRDALDPNTHSKAL